MSGDNAFEEIEITDSMMAAGAAVLESWATGSPKSGAATYRQLAACVFREMSRLGALREELGEPG
jgi:hypothetical protein